MNDSDHVDDMLMGPITQTSGRQLHVSKHCQMDYSVVCAIARLGDQQKARNHVSKDAEWWVEQMIQYMKREIRERCVVLQYSTV